MIKGEIAAVLTPTIPQHTLLQTDQWPANLVPPHTRALLHTHTKVWTG